MLEYQECFGNDPAVDWRSVGLEECETQHRAGRFHQMCARWPSGATWKVWCEWLFPVIALGLFCAGFGLPNWVVTESRKYGLWTNCTRNATEAEQEGVEECVSIAPGDSSGARVASCFALVFYIFVFFSLFRNRDKRQCEGHTPAMLGFIGVGITGGVLGVFIQNYESDDHWSEESPRLDASFWLQISAAGVGFASSILLCRRGSHEKQEAQLAYRAELERQKLHRERQAEEERKRRMRELAEAQERGDRSDNAPKQAGGGAGRGAKTATAAGELKKKLQNNRVAPSGPSRPASRPTSGRGAGNRPATARNVHFTPQPNDVSSESTASISIPSESDTSSDEDLSSRPPYYTETSGRAFSPTAPPQTPLPFLTVPEPLGPPPAYDEVMINPEYYPGYHQPPYEESVSLWDQAGYASPPRPATADSVAAGRRH
ncbi:hypothetical protein BaRGS_00033362 [Batillaria attramentaria]|uniref:Uncharacterized protein n=1 Tax=Batillaria attramentaria TaxID=370345 RepID=A0ABD0JLR9_9CAEN